MAGVAYQVADPLTAKSQASSWATYLLTGGEVAKSELSRFIFGLSSQEERLEDMGKCMNII